jgi:uncharacterized protein (TIGR02118 family)
MPINFPCRICHSRPNYDSTEPKPQVDLAPGALYDLPQSPAENQCTDKGEIMPGVKIVVLYPRPKDIDAFEKLYQQEHVPMAVEKLVGKTKFVATKVLASPQGTTPFYRLAEVHFPSREALDACTSSPGGKETMAHAVRISSGGPPIFLIAEEETFTFAQSATV